MDLPEISTEEPCPPHESLRLGLVGAVRYQHVDSWNWHDRAIEVEQFLFW